MNVLINFFFVCILCFFFSFEGNCQGVNKIERKIERKVQQRWDRKVDKTIDQGLDKIEGSIDKKPSPPPSQNKGRQSENVNSPTIQNGESKTINSNFDFIPGDEVLFYDDFEHDLAGGFPQKSHKHDRKASTKGSKRASKNES